MNHSIAGFNIGSNNIGVIDHWATGRCAESDVFSLDSGNGEAVPNGTGGNNSRQDVVRQD